MVCSLLCGVCFLFASCFNSVFLCVVSVHGCCWLACIGSLMLVTYCIFDSFNRLLFAMYLLTCPACAFVVVVFVGRCVGCCVSRVEYVQVANLCVGLLSCGDKCVLCVV